MADILLPYTLFAILIADSAYLTNKYMHFYYGGGFLAALNCGDGCDTVMMSPYSMLFKIPIPVYGLAFYVLCLILFTLRNRSALIRKIFELALIFGCLAAAIFIYILYFKIHAFCKFCLLAHSCFIALAAYYFARLRAKHST